MKITRCTLDPEAAPITAKDRIHVLPDGTVQLVLDADVFDRYFFPAKDHG